MGMQIGQIVRDLFRSTVAPFICWSACQNLVNKSLAFALRNSEFIGLDHPFQDEVAVIVEELDFVVSNFFHFFYYGPPGHHSMMVFDAFAASLEICSVSYSTWLKSSDWNLAIGNRGVPRRIKFLDRWVSQLFVRIRRFFRDVPHSIVSLPIVS